MSRFRPPLVRGPVRVRDARPLTPRMRRIVFDAAALEGFVVTRPAHVVKLFVPGPQGAPVGRAFTVRRFDARTASLEIDFLLHGHGQAAAWAGEAVPGDAIDLAGPRAGFALNEDAAWQLMAGDASALPAILSMLEALPAGMPARAFVAVHDAGEEQALATSADAAVQWVHAPDSVTAADALAAAVASANLPEGPAQVFIAGESSVVRRVRALFPRAGEAGGRVAVAAMHATGYWKQGVADHHDHQ